jgi:hypothetical protein
VISFPISQGRLFLRNLRSGRNAISVYDPDNLEHLGDIQLPVEVLQTAGSIDDARDSADSTWVLFTDGRTIGILIGSGKDVSCVSCYRPSLLSTERRWRLPYQIKSKYSSSQKYDVKLYAAPGQRRPQVGAGRVKVEVAVLRCRQNGQKKKYPECNYKNTRNLTLLHQKDANSES